MTGTYIPSLGSGVMGQSPLLLTLVTVTVRFGIWTGPLKTPVYPRIFNTEITVDRDECVGWLAGVVTQGPHNLSSSFLFRNSKNWKCLENSKISSRIVEHVVHLLRTIRWKNSK